MKKKSKSTVYCLPPEQYTNNFVDKYKLTKKGIEVVFNEERKVRFVETSFYEAIQYKTKLNVFSFGKLRLNLPFTVIAMPISIDEKGYSGSLEKLIEDYKTQKGNTLILNLTERDIGGKSKEYAKGKTLPSLCLKNTFSSFEDYMNKLRSSYRRRINQALKKGRVLKIKHINPKEFNEELHSLYLQVLNKSEFPLETLSLEFFRNTNWEYDVFYLENKPLAFVSYFVKEEKEKNLCFAFGGMDYTYRDEYDLYYNMLIHMVKQGIEKSVDFVNLGQTAEGVKQRLGATQKDRTMIAFSSSKLLTQILIKVAPLLENNKKLEYLRVFKSDEQN